MARNTRRRAAQQRNRKVLDILNGVAEDQEGVDGSHMINSERHIDTESVDHEYGDGQRQARRSARLKKKTVRDVTPAPISNNAEPPNSSPLFVAQDPDYILEAEAEEGAGGEISEAEEADEAEDGGEKELDEDGDSVASEEDTSISDSERQLRQEQEQSIANSQREQLELEQVLLTSPVSVVIDHGKEMVRGGQKGDSTTIKVAGTARAKSNYIDGYGEDGEFEDSEVEPDDEGAGSQQEDENYEESSSEDGFDIDDSRHDMGNSMRGLFGWDIEQPAEPVQRARIVDQLETQPPQPSEPSSRKRRRPSKDSIDDSDRIRRRVELQNQAKVTARCRTPIVLPADLEVATSPEMPDRTRRRRVSPKQKIQSVSSRRPPVARNSPVVADWEATIIEEGAQDEVIIVGESITYDDATKIQGLQATWKRLIQYCQKLKDKEVRRTHRYVGIEAIVERISDLVKDYKRMQRTRSRGRTVDPDTWKRTREEVKYMSEDADKIRNVLVRRAKEGKASNDLQAQADAVEYAQVIVQQVMTSLCESALECLRTYYSEEDEWLLNGGFGAVLDIIDIAGELDLTLTSLHNCAMIVLSPYPGRPIRQELRSIRGSLKNAEANEQRRGR